MVQLMNLGNLRSESDTHCRAVKLEIEDSLEEEHSPFNKRSKLSPPFQQQWSMGMNSSSIPPPTQYNPLDEPSPLGLRLRKSPSLLDLIQMRLSQGNASPSESSENTQSGKKKEAKGTGSGAGSSSSSDNKLKASNFPASLLRIGTWECVSRYEGDLVAKCYFAKHKLVWEVLDGGLKSKMEIQWSDIMALKANLPDNEPGTLDIVLTRQPLFFRETNPQPRKHTLWQATADFTGGQASINRRHFLQCPQGLLNKHFEKLIQCDPRLNWLSQQPEIVLESPYFEPKGSIFEDPNETKCHGFDQQKDDSVSTFSGFRDAPSPSAVQSSSSKSELWDPVGRTSENLSQRTPSPSSVMDPYAAEVNSSREAKEAKVLRHFNQLKVPGLHPSMSMSDLVSHLGNCLSEQMMSGDPLSSEGTETKAILEDIAQYLLSDSQLGSSSDEKCLMSRVNSLCCLLQKDPVQNSQVNSEVGFDKSDYGRFTQPQSNPDMKGNKEFAASGSGCDDSAESKQATGMSRKDSLGDLLHHLPRIASLPQFLFNIPEDGENQAR